MRIADSGQLEEMLGELPFPADKEQIVEHVHARMPESDNERAVAALPLGFYDSKREVMRSVLTEADIDTEHSTAEQVQQHRHHAHSGVAEHMRNTETPPVQEELRRDERGGL